MSAAQAPARVLVGRLVAALGPSAHDALDLALDQLSITELAALAYDWRGTWARPNQLIDAGGRWRSSGFLSARRFGKSKANSEHIHEEVEAGRAMRIGFCAQNWDKTLEVMVHGDVGLIATSPPWFKAVWENNRVLWPNGAQAFPFTPEVPGSFRGPGLHLFWASEIQSWPKQTRDEAFSNALLMTSLGYARLLWDATPQRRHPILKMLLERATNEPKIHRVTRGTINENRDNLGAGVIEDLAKHVGINTVRGREELLGEMVDDADGLVKQEWITNARRQLPGAFNRRVVACDPSITSDPRFSDRSGIIDAGVGGDGQLYVCRNLTARHRAESIGSVLVDAYIGAAADLMIIETNRGGEMPTALVRLAARELGLEVVKIERDETTPPRRAGTIYVREINNRGKKAERLRTACALLERRRVSFVVDGEGLAELEEQLLSLDGSEKGPDDASDAFAMAAVELSDAVRDGGAGVSAQLDGLAARVRASAAAVSQSTERPSPLAETLGLGLNGSRANAGASRWFGKSGKGQRTL